MSEALEPKKEYVTISQAVVIIAVIIASLSGIGYIVGKKFFWNQYDTTPLHERQIAELEKYSEENPKSRNAKVLLFDRYFGSGELTKARIILNDLKKEIGDNPDIIYRDALMLQSEGKKDKALAEIQKVVEMKPLFPYARVIYSQLLTEDKQYDKAIKEMEMALKIMPVAADLRLELAKIYLAKGDKQKALEEVDRALKMVPDYQEALDFKKQI
ncbi:MAG: hypothetical protein CVU89_14250 [Firmicutes bacterium HGW-Firmicutes-14]|nr:MAG: hypothetical protein CVU89_14250 [Firmicutes bacterium HGW-Firmicutes-14]